MVKYLHFVVVFLKLVEFNFLGDTSCFFFFFFSQHFKKCGPVYSAIVARKNDPKNPGNMLSMGYGFVQFYREQDASRALQSYQETMLENHLLELKKSSRTLQ